jgi:hypothetical protein
MLGGGAGDLDGFADSWASASVSFHHIVSSTQNSQHGLEFDPTNPVSKWKWQQEKKSTRDWSISGQVKPVKGIVTIFWVAPLVKV